MGGSTPETPKVDVYPAWLQQEEYQAGAAVGRQQMTLASTDSANFMARYGTRNALNTPAGTATSATSVLYPDGGMPWGGLKPGDANPLSITLAGQGTLTGGGLLTAPGNPAAQPSVTQTGAALAAAPSPNFR